MRIAGGCKRRQEPRKPFMKEGTWISMWIARNRIRSVSYL